MTEPEPIETFPLFPDLEPCGCPKDQGHTCRPPWMTMDDTHSPIVPEDIVLDTPGYAPGHWDYRRRCEDVAAALVFIRERIEEWDTGDLHGWWHERPELIALYNAVVKGGATRG